MTLWFMIFYFVFEMRAVRDLVASESSNEFLRQRANTAATRRWVMGSALGFSVAFHILAGGHMLAEDWFSDRMKVLGPLTVAFRVAYLAVFTWMVAQWARLASFFIRKKREKMHRKFFLDRSGKLSSR
jgi:CBS domain containing-hemolysin-like protein